MEISKHPLFTSVARFACSGRIRKYLDIVLTCHQTKFQLFSFKTGGEIWDQRWRSRANNFSTSFFQLGVQENRLNPGFVLHFRVKSTKSNILVLIQPVFMQNFSFLASNWGRFLRSKMEVKSKKDREDLIAKMIDCNFKVDGLGGGGRCLLGRVRYFYPVKN